MRRISGHVLMAFGGDAVARGLGFVATVYLTRTLGRDGYGVFSVGLGVFTYALWFTDLGTGTLGARETARPDAEREFQPSQIVGLRLLLALVMFVAAQALVYFLYAGSPHRHIYALFLFCLFPYAMMTEWYAQGLRKFGAILAARAAGGLAYLALLWLLVHGPATAQYAPLAYAASGAVWAAWLFAAKAPGHRLMPRMADLKRNGALLNRTWRLALGATFGQVVQLLPPVALGLFGNPAANPGLYGAAARVTFTLLALDRVFSVIWLPTLTAAWNHRGQQVQELMPAVFRLLAVASFALCTALAVCGADVMKLIAGDDFAESGPMLSVMCWFVVWTLLNSFFAYSLIATGREKWYAGATALGGTVAAAGILATAWLHNPLAMAAWVVCAEFIIMILMWLEFRKHFSVPVALPFLLCAATAAGLMAVARLLDLHHLLWSVPVLAAFLAITLALRVLRPADIRAVLKT